MISKQIVYTKVDLVTFRYLCFVVFREREIKVSYSFIFHDYFYKKKKKNYYLLFAVLHWPRKTLLNQVKVYTWQHCMNFSSHKYA